MRKQRVIEQFGSIKATAEALHISTQAVSHWPDTLSLAMADRVRGALVRTGNASMQEIVLLGRRK